MEFLESHGLVPGALATVSEVLIFNHTITFRVQNLPVTLGMTSARYIFVERRK